MVELKCPASQQLNLEGEPTFKTTLGGRRIAFPTPGPAHRAWQNQLSDASDPQQIGAVMAFINGEWGPGPFVYVSADAPMVNVLSPAVASCAPSSVDPSKGPSNLPAGPLNTPDGWAGRSIMSSNPTQLMRFGEELMPVIPGTQVTGSAYLRGDGASLRIYFFDAQGNEVGQYAVGAARGVAADVTRVWTTATVPAGAVSCRLRSMFAAVGTRPALTWSDALLPWGDGQGCQKAVIHGASRNLVMASRDPRGGRYSNLSFTITDVG